VSRGGLKRGGVSLRKRCEAVRLRRRVSEMQIREGGLERTYHIWRDTSEDPRSDDRTQKWKREKHYPGQGGQGPPVTCPLGPESIRGNLKKGSNEATGTILLQGSVVRPKKPGSQSFHG